MTPEDVVLSVPGDEKRKAMVEHDQGSAIFLQNDIHILLWDKCSC